MKIKPPFKKNSFLIGGFIYLVLFIYPPLNSQKHRFDYDQNVAIVYNLIIDLRIDEAKSFLKGLKTKDANNLAHIHMANYIDFFNIFVTEEEKLYKSLHNNRQLRIDYLDQHSNHKDPYFKFAKAEIMLQWALVKMKFGDKIGAGAEIYEAYRLLESNQREHPTFKHNDKSLSILYALEESVPSWIRKIIKVKGSVSLAKDKIKNLYKHSLSDEYFFKDEVTVIYTYILYYQLNEKEKAWSILNKSQFDHKTSPMKAFLKSTFANKLGFNDLSLQFAIEAPRGKAYLPLFYLDFLVGKAYLYELNPQSVSYLKKYTDNFKGQHYIKEAYQKQAWAALIFEQSKEQYLNHLSSIKQKGQKLMDEDIQALKEAEKKEIPNSTLLKARLLYDGGYFGKALELLQSNQNLEKNSKTSLEFQYRLGRTYQSQKNYSNAINYLTKSSQNIDKKSFMVCNANLQLGIIYELLDKKMLAKTHYNQCLALAPSEYRQSLHQKARSGLQRLSK